MEYPVIISGGGIIGCYIHLRLKQAGISSQIIEKGLPASGSVPILELFLLILVPISFF